MGLIVVKPGFELMTPAQNVKDLLPLIEAAGRVCYKSEDRIEQGSAEKFVRGVVKRGHESVIEHGNITVKIICDRSCSHQLVRHRIAAYSQESQRYCDYAGKQADEGLRIICPPTIAQLRPGLYEFRKEMRAWGYRGQDPSGGIVWWRAGSDLPDDGEMVQDWLGTIEAAYDMYKMMREEGGIPPEDARSVLPNAVKTEVVTTFNLRQWRHVFEERALNPHAQWQIREIMLGILEAFAALLPAVFGDLGTPVERGS